MKEYIKVTHVPLLREGSRPPASLCEVLPAGGILHLRWAAEGGSVSCAVGLPDATTLEQAKLRLELDGFLTSAEAAPAPHSAWLCRSVCSPPGYLTQPLPGCAESRAARFICLSGAAAD